MRVIITTDLAEDAVPNIIPLLSMFTESDGLEIVLFHCIEPPSSGTVAIIAINDILLQNAQDRMKEILSELEQKTSGKYHFESVVRFGFLVPEMKGYLEDENADLLVLETAKRKGFNKLIDPQRSLEFIGEIPISTLIVPTNYDFVEFKKIGVAVDKKEDVSVLNSASFESIKTYFDSQIKPFHVEGLSDKGTDFYMNGTFGNESVKITHNDSVEEGIKAWCDKENINVLCMITHHKNIFSKKFSHSVIRMMIKAGEIPVLVLTSNS